MQLHFLSCPHSHKWLIRIALWLMVKQALAWSPTWKWNRALKKPLDITGKKWIVNILCSSWIAHPKGTGWLWEMAVDSDWQFLCYFPFNCLFIPTPVAVSNLLRTLTAVTLSSLMERNLLRFSVLLRSWHFNNLCMIQSLVIQKVILECLREQLAWWKWASYLTLQPTVLLIGSFFFFPLSSDRYCPSVHLFSG